MNHQTNAAPRGQGADDTGASTSHLARLQQGVGLLHVVLFVVAACWWRDSPTAAVGLAGLVMFGQPLVLLGQFWVAARVNRGWGLNATVGAAMWRAWWAESAAATRVFGWRQPWAWRRWANSPTGQVATQGQPREEGAPASPRGVLLVHGYLCNRGLWNAWQPRLAAAGHPVVAVNLEPVWGSVDDYVPLIEAGVERLRRSTGQAPLVVAHSMGGLAVRAWMRACPGADERVHHVLTVGTPHHGTWLANWGLGCNARQMRRGSAWLAALAAVEPPARYRRFTCWHSNGDNIVFPLGTAVLAGARQRFVPDVGHLHMLDCPELAADVATWLGSSGGDRPQSGADSASHQQKGNP